VPQVTHDYTKLKSIFISPRIIPWVSFGCVMFVLLMSFFPWYALPIPEEFGKLLSKAKDKPETSFNPWTVGFGKSEGLMIMYDLFLIFGVLAAIGSLLLNLKVIPEVPALTPWRAVIVGGFVIVGFLFLWIYDLIFYFKSVALNHTFWGMLAYWAHCAAAISLLLEIWLQRRGPTYPPPRIDIHT